MYQAPTYTLTYTDTRDVVIKWKDRVCDTGELPPQAMLDSC